jgi:hypothetical protein
MNEKIRNLVRQAEEYTMAHYDPDFDDDFRSKFAELLITAVMAEVRDEIQYQSGWTLADIVTERIKKEFGVTQ